MNEEKAYIQYQLLSTKKRGGIVCPKAIKDKKWKDFYNLAQDNSIIIFGNGHMCDYFLSRYHNVSVKYIVDSAIKDEDTIEYRYNKCVFSPIRLLNENKDTLILISTIDDICSIYRLLEEYGMVNCFSLAQMENYRFSNRFGILVMTLLPQHRDRFERVWNKKIMREAEIRRLYNRSKEARLSSKTNASLAVEMRMRLARLEAHVQALQKRQTERYLYLLHLERVVNVLIDKSDDMDLKKEQIIYQFTTLYGNEYYPDFDNPQSFNEKNIYMQLHCSDNLMYAKVTDKYELKEYVRTILKNDKYVLPAYGIWNNPGDIEIDQLPDSFVLKATNGGDGKQVFIIQDKNKIDKARLIKATQEWVRTYNNLYYCSFNGTFKHVIPRIFAEELMESHGEDILDFRFWMFNGVMKLYVISKLLFSIDDVQTKQETRQSFFWADGKRFAAKTRFFKELDDVIIPKHFGEMVRVAEELSKGFEFVRVDFLSTSEKFYVDEMTLTPSGGMLPFDSNEIDYSIGSMWHEKRMGDI